MTRSNWVWVGNVNCQGLKSTPPDARGKKKEEESGGGHVQGGFPYCPTTDNTHTEREREKKKRLSGAPPDANHKATFL
jgi:hypothetical protein